MIDLLLGDSLVGILFVAALTACYEMACWAARRRQRARRMAEALKTELAVELSKAALISPEPRSWRYHHFLLEFGEMDANKKIETAQWRVPLGKRITEKWLP